MGAEVTGRLGPQSIAQANSLSLSLALDYTKPLPPTLDGVFVFDVVFYANGSLSIREGDRLIERDGKVFDIARTKWKFSKAFVSRSRKAVIAKVKRQSATCRRSRRGQQAFDSCRSNRLPRSGPGASGVVGASQTP